MRKVIKLINDERKSRRITASMGCDSTSTDFCAETNYDLAVCTVNSYDLCVKDYAGCSNSSYDYCAGRDDIKACIDPNTTDY